MIISVPTVVVVKNLADRFARDIKKPLLLGILISVIIGGGGFLITGITNNLFLVFCLLSALFILSGIVAYFIFHKKYFFSTYGTFLKKIAAELLFLLFIVLISILVFSCLEYFFKNKSFLFYPVLMSALTFFIPFLFQSSFEAAYDIPQPIWKLWQYPIPDPDSEFPEQKSGEKELLIFFEVKIKTSDTSNSPLPTKGPDNMTLGDLFYYLIRDYNLKKESKIEFIYNEVEETHKWWFRRKPKWYQRQRMLDPSSSLLQNNISNYTTIICERIKNADDTNL